jgi:hypothetical protein
MPTIGYPNAMTTLIHADIFFFVATIGFAVFIVLAIIAWIYIVKILANVKYITDKAKVEGELLIDEVKNMRHGLRRSHFKIIPIIYFIRRLIRRYT